MTLHPDDTRDPEWVRRFGDTRTRQEYLDQCAAYRFIPSARDAPLGYFRGEQPSSM